MDVNWLSADYLPWLIPFFPLASFLIITLFTTRRVVVSQVVALIGIGLAWVASMAEFIHVVWVKDIELGQNVVGSDVDWMSLGANTFKVGVMVDPLTAYMLLMVPLACLLIFIYSMGYMRGDAHNSRFFGYLALFAGAIRGCPVCMEIVMGMQHERVVGLDDRHTHRGPPRVGSSAPSRGA